ncbi:hypothetical protein SDC9_123279 [bioreactor metagenome]|uniref:Uncharacterized protein n=1 Tax=bioreactor metagenome TaxID=1076179 RepID=A0A645CH61_9ZZZZ
MNSTGIIHNRQIKLFQLGIELGPLGISTWVIRFEQDQFRIVRNSLFKPVLGRIGIAARSVSRGIIRFALKNDGIIGNRCIILLQHVLCHSPQQIITNGRLYHNGFAKIINGLLILG